MEPLEFHYDQRHRMYTSQRGYDEDDDAAAAADNDPDNISLGSADSQSVSPNVSIFLLYIIAYVTSPL